MDLHEGNAGIYLLDALLQKTWGLLKGTKKHNKKPQYDRKNKCKQLTICMMLQRDPADSGTGVLFSTEIHTQSSQCKYK